MKKLMICLLVLGLLAGCSREVDAWQINMAIKTCENRGGIDYLIPADSWVRCADGKQISLRGDK